MVEEGSEGLRAEQDLDRFPGEGRRDEEQTLTTRRVE